MASVEAAINIVVNGQQRVDQLISNIDRVAGRIEQINREPISLSVTSRENEINRQLSNLQRANDRFATVRQQEEDRMASASERLMRTIARNARIIQEADQRGGGATQTRRYAEAVRRRDNAIQELSEAQQRYTSELDRTDAEERRAIATTNQRVRSLRQTVGVLEQIEDITARFTTARFDPTAGFVPAQLRQTIQLFRDLAANVDVTSASYRRFTLATTAASIQSGREQNERFRVLADTFRDRRNRLTGEFVGSEFGAIDYSGVRAATDDLISAFPRIARSQAGLEEYRGQLDAIRRLTPIASENFIRLGTAIQEVDNILSRVTSRQPATSFGPALNPSAIGPSVEIGSIRAAKEQINYEKAVSRELSKQADLQDQINKSSLDRLTRSQLSTRVEESLSLLTAGRLEDSRDLTREIAKQLSRQEKNLRPTTTVFGTEGAQYMPITGRTKEGIVPDSPAARQRQAAVSLNWQLALAQMNGIAEDLSKRAGEKRKVIKVNWNSALQRANEIVSDGILKNLQEGTKAANALGRQKFREIERATADLWERFGGPALPPSMRPTPKGGTLTVGALGTGFMPVSGVLPNESVALGSPAAEKMQREFASAKLDVLERIKRVQDEINTIMTTEAEKQRLTKQLATSRVEIEQGRLDVAEKIAKQTLSDARTSRRNFKDEQIQSRLLENDWEKLEKLITNAEIAYDKFKQNIEDIELFPAASAKKAQEKLDAADFDSRLKIQDKITESTKALPGQLKELEILQNNWNKAKQKGVAFTDEDFQSLQNVIDLLKSPQFTPTATSKEVVNTIIGSLKRTGRLRVSQTPAGGGGAGADVANEIRLGRALESTFKFRGEIAKLQAKGIDLSVQRAAIEQEILNIQKLQGSTTKEQYQIAAKNVQAIRNAVMDIVTSVEQASKLTGFGAKFASFQESLSASRTYFGAKDPAQAVSDIVKAFNERRGGTTAAGGSDVADSVTESFTTGLKTGVPKAVSVAIAFSKAVIDAFRDTFKARSPAREIINKVVVPIVQAFEGLRDFTGKAVSAAKAFAGPIKKSIVQEFSASGLRGGEISDTAARVAAFVARTSSKSSVFRKFANLAGEDILSSPAVTEAIYRKSYERGEIVPPMYLPAWKRRFLRGTAGIPGAGLEPAVRASAISSVSKTGAFVGPLPAPITSTIGISSVLGPALGKQAIPAVSKSTAPIGVFEAQVASAEKVVSTIYSMVGKNTSKEFNQLATQITGKSASAAVDKLKANASTLWASLIGKAQITAIPGGQSASSALSGGKAMGGFPVDAPAQIALGRNTARDTSKVVIERIKQYRADIDNFWEGTDSQFSAVSRLLKSGTQLSLARLARKLQQGRSVTPENQIEQQFADIAAEARKATKSGRTSRLTTIRSSLSRLIETVENAGMDVADGFENNIVDPIRTGVEGVFGGTRSPIAKLLNDLRSSASGIPGAGGGGRPPGGTGGTTGAPEPGDFSSRLNQAAEEGVQALLGLRELREPTRASIADLELLSGVLKEVYANLDPTVAGFDKLEKEIRQTVGRLDEFNASRQPDADPLVRAVRSPRRAQAISEGLIGGAFPLLFGQGVGASVLGGIGGAAGGFMGGSLGFGLSLIGTALGSALDTAIQKAVELGTALNNTSTVFDTVKQRSLFSSMELEKAATRLQEAGLVASASGLAQQEIFKKVGLGGIRNLEALATESDRLNRAWSELSLQIQAAIAGPLAGLLEWVSSVVDVANNQFRRENRTRDIFESLSPEQQKLFNEKVRQRVSAMGQVGLAAPVDGSPAAFEIGASTEEYARIRAQIANEFANGIDIKFNPKITGKQKIESDIALLSKNLEVIDIGKQFSDQVKAAAREQKDLDRQRADIVRSYEESLGEIRKKVEDEVQRRRFSVLEKENELLDIQGQNRIKQLQLANLKFISQAGAGDTPEIKKIAKEAAAIVAEFTEQQVSAEEEAAKIKRNAALQARMLDFEGAKFKADIEKEVSKLNIETARRVSEINENIRKRNEDTDTRRFDIEKQIAILRLDLIAEEYALMTHSPGINSAYYEGLVRNIEITRNNIKEVKKMQPLSELGQVNTVKMGPASFRGLNAAISNESEAIRSVVEEELNGLEIGKKINTESFKQKMLGLTEDAEQPLSSMLEQMKEEEKRRMRYTELVRQGRSADLANQIIEIENATKLVDLGYLRIISLLEEQKVREGISKQVRDQIDLEIERIRVLRGELPGKKDKAIKDAEKGESFKKKIGDEIDRVQLELDKLLDPANQLITIAGSIGTAFSESFKGVISGSMTAKEALANFFQSTANAFLDMAAQIIQKWVVVSILKSFNGGAADGAVLGAPSIPSIMPNAVGNIYARSNIVPFANGGSFTNSIVQSPTLFKFADGAGLSTGVMGEAGPEAIMPLRRGRNGKLGVEASGSGASSVEVTVNVDAKGTSVQGDNQAAGQLGRVIAGVVRQELINQQRQGGLLNR